MRIVEQVQPTTSPSLILCINLQSPDVRILPILVVLHDSHLHQESPQSLPVFSATNIV